MRKFTVAILATDVISQSPNHISQSPDIFCQKHLKQAIVEGADPYRTQTGSEFSCLDIKHIQSLLRDFNNIK